MEELDRKLNRLSNSVLDMAKLQARNAEYNQRAFEATQAEFQEVRLLISINSQAIQETRQLIDSNARAIEASSETGD